MRCKLGVAHQLRHIYQCNDGDMHALYDEQSRAPRGQQIGAHVGRWPLIFGLEFGELIDAVLLDVCFGISTGSDDPIECPYH